MASTDSQPASFLKKASLPEILSMGMSLFACLTMLRMNKARDLLLKGNRKVSAVARAVGYENSNYFAKVFRKYFGQSPSDVAASAGSDRTGRNHLPAPATSLPCSAAEDRLAWPSVLRMQREL
jgi:AraC-like DNA-binding protein